MGLKRLGRALAFLLAAPALADAQESAPPGRRSIVAVRLGDHETIRLDGRFDEEVWARAEPATDFIQIDPANGTPATERTEVRIVYTRDALYMGVTCFDSEPDKWIGYQRRRDEFLPADDRFMWTIDTFRDERSGYFFEMNPSGLMADSLMGGGIDNRQWDGIWDARVLHTDIGWTIEIELPFRSLNFDPDGDSWGFNFQRTVRRKNEDSIWMGWARNQGLRRMTNAGIVSGIREASQGLGLDVKPYGLVTAESSPGRGQSAVERDGDVGVDLFYSPTPGLRTVLTVNTDFAQTEVDQRQVNLTRFSLFFPEKRDFFLDGAPFFAFSSPSGGDLIVNPFFSRRVGLTAVGTPQPIDFGAKLTGQVGRHDVGALHVRTSDEPLVKGEDFTVARVRRRILAQSSFGGLFTRRALHGTDGAALTTAGLDFRLATSSFLGNQNLEGSGYYLHTGGAIEGGDDAFGFRAAAPNDLLNLQFSADQVGARFDPAVGFVTRHGYRRYLSTADLGLRPRGHRYVRRVGFGGISDVQTDLGNQLLVRFFDVKFIDVQFHSQDAFFAGANHTRERLDEDFPIAPGITLPMGGEYGYARMIVGGQTANRRVLAVNGNFQSGQFYDGTRKTAIVNLTLRARPGLIVYAGTEWNGIDLPDGRFSTRLFRLIGETQFSPWVALVNNFQYDSVSDVLGWQSRFRWILRPGRDIYFVYTHNWREDPGGRHFATLDRRVATKVLYTHRF